MTKSVFSIELNLVATAYIRAGSKEEAMRLLQEKLLAPGGGEIATFDGTASDNTILVSGARFDSARLPQVSLSPAITIEGLSSPETHFELVHSPEDNSMEPG